jgi:hypothetical protein
MIIDKFKNFFTKEDNNLEIVTNIHTTYEFLEVVEAKKAQPKWWKDLPALFNNHHPISRNEVFNDFKQPIQTLKYCPAIQDIFSTGLVIKAWSDFIIFVSPDGIVESVHADDGIKGVPPGSGSTHPYIQRAGFLNNFAHFKLIPTFFFKTKTYRKFLFKGAYWYNPSLIENNIHIVPAIIDYKTQTGVNMNMFFPIKSEPYQVKINFGDPLIHLIPLDNKPINVTRKLVDDNEFHKLGNPHMKFVGSSKILKSRN